MLLLLWGACPSPMPEVSSATRALDLRERGLLRTHLAIALPADGDGSIARRLRFAGFERTPRGRWHLYYRATRAEEVVRLLGSTAEQDSTAADAPGFSTQVDAALHHDTFPFEPKEVTTHQPRMLVLARLGAEPEGLKETLRALMGGDAHLRPGKDPSPARRARPLVLLLDRRGAQEARLGVILSSTAAFGMFEMEAVGTALGDGAMSRIARALREHVDEPALGTLAMDDASESGVSLTLTLPRSALAHSIGALSRVLRQIESAGLTNEEAEIALRRARTRRILRAATPRGRLETALLDHLRLGASVTPAAFDCLNAARIRAATKAVSRSSGLRLVVEADLEAEVAAELAREWPRADIELRRNGPEDPR